MPAIVAKPIPASKAEGFAYSVAICSTFCRIELGRAKNLAEVELFYKNTSRQVIAIEPISNYIDEVAAKFGWYNRDQFTVVYNSNKDCKYQKGTIVRIIDIDPIINLHFCKPSKRA